MNGVVLPCDAAGGLRISFGSIFKSVWCSMRWKMTAVAVGAAMVVGARVHAEAPLAKKYVDQIGLDHARVAELQQWLGDTFAGVAQQAPGYERIDHDFIYQGAQKEIDLWNAAAAAWAKSNDAVGSAKEQEAFALGGKDHDAWQQRLNWRIRQHNESPSEDSFEQVSGWTPRHGLALSMEAQKKVVAACARVAEAIVPGVDPETIHKLEDAVFAAQLEVEVANMHATWEAEDNSWAMRDAVSSPALTAAQQTLNEHRKQREILFRAYRMEQHEVEKFDRANAGLIQERDKQAELARQQRDHPDGK
jgi:hypothetical protein